MDLEGRGYRRLSPAECATYSIPRGNTWWWCVLPPKPRRARRTVGVPRVGARSGRYMIYKISLGFQRGGIVGVVGMR